MTAWTVCSTCKRRFQASGHHTVMGLLDQHRLDAHGIPLPPPTAPYTPRELSDVLWTLNVELDDDEYEPPDP